MLPMMNRPHPVALLAMLAMPACGGGKADDCSRAVRHFFELEMSEGAAGGSAMSAGERAAIDHVAASVIDGCRKEGLSREVADCMVAAHWPDPDDQMRACPAFAAKPPTWARLRPARENRAGLRGAPATANGPKEGPVHYQQIVGTNDTTCGLTAAGAIQCWGAPLPGGALTGTFTQLAISEQRLCGLDPQGHAHCVAGTDPMMAVAPRIPDEVFAAIALGDSDGCGIRKRDSRLVCWSDTEAPAHPVPAGTFLALEMTSFDVCALRTDHHVICFGDTAPSPPSETFAALGTGWPYGGVTTDGAARTWPDGAAFGAARTALSCSKGGCCTIGADGALSCNTATFGAAPAGTFQLVAVLGRNRACAVHDKGGGTVCWGDNDAGACNVPQT
jgi:hypothetical protein